MHGFGALHLCRADGGPKLLLTLLLLTKTRTLLGSVRWLSVMSLRIDLAAAAAAAAAGSGGVLEPGLEPGPLGPGAVLNAASILMRFVSSVRTRRIRMLRRGVPLICTVR